MLMAFFNYLISNLHRKLKVSLIKCLKVKRNSCSMRQLQLKVDENFTDSFLFLLKSMLFPIATHTDFKRVTSVD